jgi:hypothetical protein
MGIKAGGFEREARIGRRFAMIARNYRVGIKAGGCDREKP